MEGISVMGKNGEKPSIGLFFRPRKRDRRKLQFLLVSIQGNCLQYRRIESRLDSAYRPLEVKTSRRSPTQVHMSWLRSDIVAVLPARTVITVTVLRA